MTTDVDNCKPIESITFAIYGNDEVKRNSVIKEDRGIIYPETLENGEPKRGGLIDLRLGVMDHNNICATCNLKTDACPSHFGHTEFKVPVYSPGYKEYIKGILGIICIKCSKMLIKNDQIQNDLMKIKKGNLRYIEAKKQTSNIVTCQECGSPVPSIKMETKNGGIQIYAEYNVIEEEGDIKFGDKKKRRHFLSPKVIFDIFTNIELEQLKFIGINGTQSAPPDMIIKILPIAPVAIRPSTRSDILTNGSSEDTLNNKYADILKAEARVNKMIEKGGVQEAELKYIHDYLDYVQSQVNGLQSNDSNTPVSQVKSSGRQVKSIEERLKGKQGRVRGNLMGKRVNFCARTVITSDPNLSLDELGVPIKIAMNVTFPEIVTKFNIDFLTVLVNNGRKVYPGANCWATRRGTLSNKYMFRDLRYGSDNIKLNMGDIVERHLIDGDCVLFNRQPTLHKMSMMCHKIKIINNDKFSTFRLNVSTTNPYNADFDGDEMNMFVPQTIQTQLELSNIADVKRQIISPRYSTPIIKLKQDTVLGTFKMTEIKRNINWHDAMNLIMYTYDTDVYKIIKKDINSHQLYSYIIPPSINYEDKEVKIVNREIVSGKLTGGILNKIMSYSWDRHDPTITQTYINNTQRLTIAWLMNRGFTVGFGDAVPTIELQKKVGIFMEKQKLEVDQMLTEIENHPDILDPEIFEQTVSDKLNKKADIAKMTLDSLNSDNNFYTIIFSGAKGSNENMGQIMSGNTQDYIKFVRIPKMVNNRALPHYHQNNDRAEARGYISSSYYLGFTPEEFWFHHMTGREGLINTAIKTSETGYMQKKLIKGLEDIMVTYDGSVRTSNNILLQVLFGGSQLDQSMQKLIKLNILMMGDSDIKSKFCFSQEELQTQDSDTKEIDKEYYKTICEMRDIFRVKQLLVGLDYMSLTEMYFQPANLPRIIADHKNLLVNTKSIKLTAKYVIDSINMVLDHDNTPLLCLVNKEKNPLKYKDEQRCKFLFKLALYEYLSPKRCIIEYKFDKYLFDMVIKEILRTFNNALVNPGEMVGIISAQSIGEPLTQMTLSSFHKTGAGTSGLQGVPRMKEILSCSKNIEIPLMYIYLDDKYKDNKLIAEKISSYLKYTLMKDLASKIDIIFDPETTTNLLPIGNKVVGITQSETSHSTKDNIDTKSVFFINNVTTANIDTMPWLFRITLSKEKMIENHINMLDIKTSFINFWNNNYNDMNGLKKSIKDLIAKVHYCCILTNFSNSDQPIVHIRFELNQVDNKTLLEFYDIILNKFNLKGSPNITSSEVNYKNYYTFDNPDKKYENKKEYVIYTKGIDLAKIKNIKAINMNKTVINDLYTVYKQYGIEAARSLLLREMNKLFDSDKKISYHHLSLIVDMMTSTGGITSIDRHGINKLDTDPLSRISFEVVVDQCIKAAVFNEVDKLRSVSSQIMIGAAFKGGTGLCQLLMDNNMLENMEPEDTLSRLVSTEYYELRTNDLIDDLIENDDFDVFIPK